MSQIAPELIDRMMVKCARRCCICRRFRPTKLQVHHIDEKAKGGSDDEENLIVVCLSCHTDVHTKVPFARRFSVEELKGHRDALIRLVADGKLPAHDSDDADHAIAQIVGILGRLPHTANSLSPEAVEILLTTVAAEGAAQGNVHAIQFDGGFAVMVGNGKTFQSDDRRLQAKYRQGFKQLVETGLLDHVSAELYEVNADGYLVADELAVQGSH